LAVGRWELTMITAKSRIQRRKSSLLPTPAARTAGPESGVDVHLTRRAASVSCNVDVERYPPVTLCAARTRPTAVRTLPDRAEVWRA
jgi:hypothetical protein